MAKKSFNFPVWLQGSPEEQEAEAQRQATLRASFSRARLTEAEQLIGRGHLLEETARGNIEAARGKDAEARVLAENQLAEALAMQGKFSEAAETHHDVIKRAEFRAVGKALELDDAEKCDCPDLADGLTPRFERKRIFSPIHQQVVSVVECQTCGHVNARPITSRLLAKNTAMNRNHQMVRANKAGSIDDAQLARGVIRDATALATSR